MPNFSKKSLARLNSAHPDLQRLFNEVIKHIDCTILCGHRGKEEQNEAFRTGKSKAKWPESKHNTVPSLAVDVVPWPLDWSDTVRFKSLAAFVLATAEKMGIKIRWGGNFSNIVDLPHFELYNKLEG